MSSKRYKRSILETKHKGNSTRLFLKIKTKLILFEDNRHSFL